MLIVRINTDWVRVRVEPIRLKKTLIGGIRIRPAEDLLEPLRTVVQDFSLNISAIQLYFRVNLGMEGCGNQVNFNWVRIRISLVLELEHIS